MGVAASAFLRIGELSSSYVLVYARKGVRLYASGSSVMLTDSTPPRAARYVLEPPSGSSIQAGGVAPALPDQKAHGPIDQPTD